MKDPDELQKKLESLGNKIKIASAAKTPKKGSTDSKATKSISAEDRLKDRIPRNELIAQLHASPTLNNLEIHKTDLSDLDIPNLNLSGCTFIQVDFSDSILENFQATQCKFYQCDFKNSKMLGAQFTECKFYNKDDGQRSCNFGSANLRHAEFVSCDLSLCSFKRAQLFQVTMSECQAQGSDFSSADFTSNISNKKFICAATLTGCSFKYADFSSVTLEGCDLSKSKFWSTNLTRANLEKANLMECEIINIISDGLSIIHADLRNAEITGLDFRQLDMTGVKIQEWQQTALLESLGFVIYPN